MNFFGNLFGGGFDAEEVKDIKSFHELSALDIDKKEVKFSALKDQVLLVVNVASNLSAQEFNDLMSSYSSRGFNIIAFPCNQFMGQEPGTNDQIKEFAASKGFSGILMDKISVNGKDSSNVYKWLKMSSGDTADIGWNFGKGGRNRTVRDGSLASSRVPSEFLVKKNGEVASRYGPRTSPLSIAPDIEKALNE